MTGIIRAGLIGALIAGTGLAAAAETPRTGTEPRFSGSLNLGLARLPGGDGAAPQGRAVAGGRLALAIAPHTDSGPRLGIVIEIEAPGPSGPWRN